MALAPENNNWLRKKKIRRISFIFIVALLLLTFFSNTINNFSLPRVSVEQPVSGSLIKEVEGSGMIEAREYVHKYVDQGRLVIDVNVSPGDRVAKGQVLVILDSDNLNQQLKTELLRYDQMKLNLEKLTESYPANDANSFESAISNSQINLEAAQKNFNRMKSLFDAGSASREELDNAGMELLKTERDLENEYRKQSDYEEDIKSQQESFQKDIQVQKISLQLEEIVIEDLRKKLEEECELISPVDGIVSELNVEKGSLTDGSLPVFSIVDLSKGFELRIPVDTDKAEYVKTGDTVELYIKSLEGEPLEGRVREIAGSTQNTGEVKDLIIDLPNDGVIISGENCEIYLRKKTRGYGVLVPNAAIGRDGKGEFVWVVYEKERPLGNEFYVRKAAVYTDDSDSSKTVVLNGLTIHDTIVVKYSKNISDGSRIILD